MAQRPPQHLGIVAIENESFESPSNMVVSFTYTYLPNPSARAGYDTRLIFKRSLTGLNSEFSFSQAIQLYL